MSKQFVCIHHGIDDICKGNSGDGEDADDDAAADSGGGSGCNRENKTSKKLTFINILIQ